MAGPDLLLYATIASGAMSAVSAISQGNAASDAANSQAQAAEYNAMVGRQNAENANRAASANEEAQRRKSAGDMGRLRAGLAENGIGLDSGTATDLTEQSSMNAELDALNIRYQGRQQARGYETGAALDTQQAQNARNQASSAQTAGYIGAGTAALTAAGKYSGYKARIEKGLPAIG